MYFATFAKLGAFGSSSPDAKSRRRLFSCQCNLKMLIQGLRCAIGVHDIVTKAINVLGLVRTECGQSLPVRSVFLLQ
jgi:hypothetical protein